MKTIRYMVFVFFRFWINLFFPKYTFDGLENLPEEPCILIGNHSQIHGPVVSEVRFPGKPYAWCASQMMICKEVPAYAYQDFWSRKPKWSKWFFKLLAYLLAPISVCLFNCARTIGVYHDRRIIKTFNQSVERLQQGHNIIIFPEHDVPHNHIVCDFQLGFSDVARTYYKKTGKALAFAPMYIAPKRKQVIIGKPVYYNPKAPVKNERTRICNRLMDDITAMAEALPRHIVVPYNNLSKKQYGYNKSLEVRPDEKTGC